jgi:hypothetical protein
MWIWTCEVRCRELAVLFLVNGAGNPRVNFSYPYPYPAKPVTCLGGKGTRPGG